MMHISVHCRTAFVFALFLGITTSTFAQTKPRHRLVAKNEEGSTFNFAISPDGKTIVTADFEHLGVWDVASGKRTHHFKTGTTLVSGSIRFQPDGKSVILQNSSKIVGYDVTDGKMTELFKMDPEKEPKALLLGMAIAKNGELIGVIGVEFKEYQIRNLTTGKTIREGMKDFSYLSPDGIIAMMHMFQDKPKGTSTFFQFVDVESGKVLARSDTPDGLGPERGFGSGSQAYYLCGQDRTIIWDPKTAKEVSVLNHKDHMSRAAGIDGSGKVFATLAGKESIRVWNAAGKVLLDAKEPTEKVYDIALSTKGDLLAVLGNDGIVKIWNVPIAK